MSIQIKAIIFILLIIYIYIYIYINMKVETKIQIEQRLKNVARQRIKDLIIEKMEIQIKHFQNKKQNKK